MSYKQNIGHILEENKDLHVCGYDKKNNILIQDGAGTPMKKYKLYESFTCIYFNYKGKRVIVKNK